MLIAIDFDGTVVEQSTDYDDLLSPLVLKPNAREGLAALKQAGHVLLLYSARANRALRFNPELDPLALEQGFPLEGDERAAFLDFHQRRFQQMVDFVAMELPGVFDAIDDGAQGKPHVDLFIDDRAVRMRDGVALGGWAWIAQTYA